MVFLSELYVGARLPRISAIISGGSKGARVTRTPPWVFKFFQFHAVFEKIWQNRMLAPPSRGNPGSATDYYKIRIKRWLFITSP